jgi:putative zinc finger/helix-turn-helix YgiT family protein
MTHKGGGKARRLQGDRSFPWRCPNCRQKEVYRSSHPWEGDIKHDGRSYRLSLPRLSVPICRACGEVVFDENADDQVNAALRSKVGLLSPAEILREADRYSLSQRELAKELGIAEATLSRWVTGVQIQSKGMDNLLRMYFEQRRNVSARSNWSEQSETDAIMKWGNTFPNVPHIGEVFEYARTVAARGQLLLLGTE